MAMAAASSPARERRSHRTRNEFGNRVRAIEVDERRRLMDAWGALLEGNVRGVAPRKPRGRRLSHAATVGSESLRGHSSTRVTGKADPGSTALRSEADVASVKVRTTWASQTGSLRL
jgi:hypothetical protein